MYQRSRAIVGCLPSRVSGCLPKPFLAVSQGSLKPIVGLPLQTSPTAKASLLNHRLVQAEPDVAICQKMSSKTTPPPTPDASSGESAQRQQREPTAREQRLESLRAANLALEKQIAEVQAKTDENLSKLKNPSPEKTVKQHIKLLHDFNEIRDVGLGLIGMVAENRQVRVQEIMTEFGVSAGD